MEVDLVIAGTGLEALAMAMARAETISIEGLAVPVAHSTDLVVMKLLAGRGKDLDDGVALLCTGRVDELEVRQLLEQFEDALGVSDLVARLDEALALAHAWRCWLTNPGWVRVLSGELGRRTRQASCTRASVTPGATGASRCCDSATLAHWLNVAVSVGCGGRGWNRACTRKRA